MRSFFSKKTNIFHIKTNKMASIRILEQENHRNFIRKSVFISMLS